MPRVAPEQVIALLNDAEGRRADYKKAMITLAAGQSIDVTTGI